MEQFLMECARQVPAFGVLAWLSYTFMRHNEAITDRVIKALERSTSAIGANNELFRQAEGRTDE